MEPRLFGIDTDVMQNLYNVGLIPELMTLSRVLNFDAFITKTCFESEFTPGVKLTLNPYLGTGTLKLKDDTKFWTPAGNHMGENSIFKTIESTGTTLAVVGITETNGSRKAEKINAVVLNHLELLGLMFKAGIISLSKAINVYATMPHPKKYNKKNFIEFYCANEKNILSKLGIIALLAYEQKS